MSDIMINNAEKNSKDGGDELAEMENMLKSGAFPKDLSGTFKKIRQEVGETFDKVSDHAQSMNNIADSNEFEDGMPQDPRQGIQGDNQFQSQSIANDSEIER